MTIDKQLLTSHNLTNIYESQQIDTVGIIANNESQIIGSRPNEQ